jgi:hypothetical protein
MFGDAMVEVLHLAVEVRYTSKRQSFSGIQNFL